MRKKQWKRKENYNHYLDKRSEIMNKTQIKIEDIFGSLIGEQSIFPEQLNKPNKILAKMI